MKTNSTNKIDAGETRGSAMPANSSKGRHFIKNLDLEELIAFVKGKGYPEYRARQIWKWVYVHRKASFAEMTNMPLQVRQVMDESFALDSMCVEKVLPSKDGSTKFIYRLKDELTIESVLIPEDGRMTLCVSTQVGCSMGCTFCLTGTGGLKRKLDTGEIVDQVIFTQRDLQENQQLTNIVFMGMGEPLANFNSLKKALEIITDPGGMAISAHRITVSTVGLANRIRRAARELPPVALAVSLNAPDDKLRSQLMPANRKFPIRELLGSCGYYAKATGNPVTFEYVLLHEVNDWPTQAHRLARLLKDIPCKVNLIPLNPFKGCAYSRPPQNAVLAFQAELKRAGLNVFVRKSRGRDIGAACGQLGGSRHVQKKVEQD